MTILETGGEEARVVMCAVYPRAGKAHVIGVTGAPGVGKSTLIDALAAEYRQQKKTVGIVCVDPTSPFTGGALLGDRVRMQGRSTENGVFIRSMASRGQAGGVARATRRVVMLLDAAGFDVIFVETLGAGQADGEIRYTAQTICLVTAPHSGDAVQALKAGIFETAHVLVVNKSDVPAAEATVAALQGVLDLNEKKEGAWIVPVLKTSAERNEGIAELRETFTQHDEFLKSSGQWQQWHEQAAQHEIITAAQELLWTRFNAQSRNAIAPQVRAVLDGQTDPNTAAERLVQEFMSQLVH
jgi:LAO/AO transport system kinase